MALRREVDRPLRRDVRLLGKVLGIAIAEQAGLPVLELEERVRKLAIARRRGPRGRRAEAEGELAALLGGLSPSQAEPLIRAFSIYFRLVNIAEQHHRVRRARAHADDPASGPQRGSVAATLLAARAAGVTAEQARRAIATLEITLTFTAHPTEAARRTVLEKLYRIAQRLEERDRCQRTPREQAEWEASIREEITLLWQTDELRRERPSVGDEVKNVLWYLEAILWDLCAELPHELARAFDSAYGEPLGVLAPPPRLHSWVGGDMDGNPFVTPEVLLDATRAYHGRGLERLRAAVRELGGELSQSSRHVTPPAALLASNERDAAGMPSIAAQHAARTEGEPWRRKLRFIEARLEASLAEVSTRRALALPRAPSAGGPGGADALRREAVTAPEGGALPYQGSAELVMDLEVVADSLAAAGGAHSGARRARDLCERARWLGLHIAELEVRAPAADARAAAASVAAAVEPPPGAARLLGALAAMATAQAEGGEAACRTLVLSMAEGARDVTAALECARARGLWDEARGSARLDVVPLFETSAALDGAPAIVGELLADPGYRRHVLARGVQEVMIGYSDSGKEVGLLAASAALRRAEESLPVVAAAAGVPLRIFHGRGESVARGGGPAQQAILALPPGAVAGRYKATEQGEALELKYGRPELGERTLELIVGGALLHTLGAVDAPPDERRPLYVATLDQLGEIGRRVYRSLVWEEPRFAAFFAAATPIEELARLNLGSRPSKRAAGGLETLRAIPWVFAWTQNRSILPGWYGVGSALAEVGEDPRGLALLGEMVQKWPFFRAVIDNVEMVLAKSDLAITARYAALAEPGLREAVWPRITAEHARTVRWVKRITGRRRLLDGNLSLQRSIALRNPYVDPLSFLQVELTRGARAGDPRCERPLLLTVNGVAGGMRGTG